MRFGLTTDFRNPPDSGRTSSEVYIKERVAEVPVEMFTMMLSPPGIALREVEEHIELFAKKVMPHFRSA